MYIPLTSEGLDRLDGDPMKNYYHSYTIMHASQALN